MRVSVLRSDHGYPNYERAVARGAKIRILLDGVEVRECIIADTDQGYVMAYQLDARGQVFPDPARDRLAVETRFGVVAIEITESDRPAIAAAKRARRAERNLRQASAGGIGMVA